jgi:hypothetical protein
VKFHQGKDSNEEKSHSTDRQNAKSIEPKIKMQTKRQEFKRNKTNEHQNLKKEQEKSEFSKRHQKDREREREDNYSKHDNYILKCRFFGNRKSSKLVFSKYHL